MHIPRAHCLGNPKPYEYGADPRTFTAATTTATALSSTTDRCSTGSRTPTAHAPRRGRSSRTRTPPTTHRRRSRSPRQSYRAEESCTNSKAENYNSSIDNSSGNGIIKPITIEDFSKNSSSDQISKECKETIINTLIGQDVSYVYDEIIIINIPRDNKCRIEPMRTNAISMAGYPNITIHTLKKLFFRVSAVCFLRQNV